MRSHGGFTNVLGAASKGRSVTSLSFASVPVGGGGENVGALSAASLGVAFAGSGALGGGAGSASAVPDATSVRTRGSRRIAPILPQATRDVLVRVRAKSTPRGAIILESRLA